MESCVANDSAMRRMIVFSISDEGGQRVCRIAWHTLRYSTICVALTFIKEITYGADGPILKPYGIAGQTFQAWYRRVGHHIRSIEVIAREALVLA